MMKLLFCFLLLASFTAKTLVLAQEKSNVEMPIVFTIPAIALVDFAGSEKKIIFTSGKGAEQIITPSTLDKTWINYSSIIDGNSTNAISVNISSGNLPAQMGITLEVGKDAGAGAGATGKPVGKILLSEYPQEIITGIGSCYTGRGIQKGHQLVYSWDWLPPYNSELPPIENIEVSVIYTLTSSK